MASVRGQFGAGCRRVAATVLVLAMALPPGHAAAQSAGRWSLSGEHRVRYESLDPQFRPLLDADDEVLAFRTSLTATASWPRWSFTGELQDSRAELNDTGSLLNTSVVNTLEPLQMLATRRWAGLPSGGSASVRFGRMTDDLGGRRLLARNNFRNTRNAFQGFDFAWQGPANRSLRLLHLAPVIAMPRLRQDLLANEQALDEVADDTRLDGLLYGQPLGIAGDAIELYWLGFEADELVARRKLSSVGTRLWREPGARAWHYEVELVRQTGRSSALVNGALERGLDHDASFVHLEIGRSFEAPLSPRLELELDVASGDRDPGDNRNERYDTLYGSRRSDFGPTGIYGPFARANLRSPGFRLRLAPGSRWETMFAWRSFRLDSPRDLWTTTLLRDASGQAGDSLGHQLEASAVWRPTIERLRIEFGAARFEKGGFVRRTAPALGATSVYWYVATTIAFFDSANR